MDYTLKCKRFDDMSDRDLVDAIIVKNEDDASFCLFYHKLIKFFEYLSYKFSKLRLSAGDIASEMFVFLKNNNWEKFRTFSFKSTLFGWIKVVTNNFLLNKVKKISPLVYDEVFFTDLIENYGGDDEYNPIDRVPDPKQKLIEEIRDNADIINELYKAIDSLSPYAREVVRLRGLMGISAKETAEIISKSGKEITPGAVDQIYKRAKDIIREILRGKRD